MNDQLKQFTTDQLKEIKLQKEVLISTKEIEILKLEIEVIELEIAAREFVHVSALSNEPT